MLILPFGFLFKMLYDLLSCIFFIIKSSQEYLQLSNNALFALVFVSLKKSDVSVVDWLPSLAGSSIHHCSSLSPGCLHALLGGWIGNSPALVSKWIRVYCSLPRLWAHLFHNSMLCASHSTNTQNPRDKASANNSAARHTMEFFSGQEEQYTEMFASLKINVFIRPSNSFSVWITLIMCEVLLNLSVCDCMIYDQNRRNYWIQAVEMALKEVKSVIYNFPNSMGIIPASCSQESCVTKANNWKIIAASTKWSPIHWGNFAVPEHRPPQPLK